MMPVASISATTVIAIYAAIVATLGLGWERARFALQG